MTDKDQPTLNFGIDPHKTPIFYVDTYLISSNENVVTFNFAQATPDPSQQNVISRVAMTKQQAKDFVKNLGDHIEKFEV
jgi:hypothetical protein